MWYVNAGNLGHVNQSNTIELRTSNGGAWSDPVTCNFPASSMGIIPWHIDVIYVPEKNEYWMVYCGYPTGGSSSSNMKLYFAKSTDRVNWSIDSTPILNYGASGKWDSHTIYRTSILYDAATNKIRLWYAANADDYNTWHIGYTEGIYGNTVTLGDTTVEATDDNYDKGQIFACKCTLASQKTLDSISAYLPAISGRYDWLFMAIVPGSRVV